MKRASVVLVLSLLCSLGFVSVAKANPTLSQPDSNGGFTVKEDSEDPDFVLEKWLYSVLDHVFGRDRKDGRWRYYPGHGGRDNGPGDNGPRHDFGGGGGGWDNGPGDVGPRDDFGTGGWDNGPGDVGPHDDFGDGGWSHDDADSCPAQTIPAPGALVLGSIGLSFIGWLRRRRTL